MPSQFLREIMQSNPEVTRREVNMDLAKPYTLSGPVPLMKYIEVSSVANLAWARGFAARFEEGLVVRIYGGDTYLMVCYRMVRGVHRFQEANGNGWVFGPGDFGAFLDHLATLKPVVATPPPVMRVSSYTGRASTF